MAYPRSCVVFSVFLFCSSLPLGTQAQGRPVARWDVVPWQALDSIFNVGVVAFHPGGCTVEFRVNGITAATVSQPTLNERTDVWEYWFPLDPSTHNDSALDVSALVTPADGNGDSYQLSTIVLYANHGGSLLPSQIPVWVDAIAGDDGSGSGTENSPFRTIPKAMSVTPPGGIINLKAGVYASASLGGGSNRPYWTTIQAAPGVIREDVIILPGRPGTQRVKWTNVYLRANRTTAGFDTILVGENGSHYVWVDNIRAQNLGTRYGGSVNVFGNRYSSFVTGGISEDIDNGIGGSLIRNHILYKIKSDAWSGGGRLVVNCDTVDIDPADSGAHPDFHQSYSTGDDWTSDVILYNVRCFNCRAQGLFGLRLRNSAFVNVLMERVPDSVFLSQYSGFMENVMFWHMTLVRQNWLWRDSFNGSNIHVYNNIFNSMGTDGNPYVGGITLSNNHFNNNSPWGEESTTGDPQYINTNASDYRVQSVTGRIGKVLSSAPADMNGIQYGANRARGCYALDSPLRPPMDSPIPPTPTYSTTSSSTTAQGTTATTTAEDAESSSVLVTISALPIVALVGLLFSAFN